MKKRQLSKNLRLGSIILCIAIIGVLITLSYNTYKYPGSNETKASLYKYASQANVNYEVLLKPNSLYDVKNLGEDQVYLSNLVESIDTTYVYGFTGERAAEIKGTYEIHAVIEGYSGEGDKLTTLWKKEIPLVAITSFEAKDSKFLITKKIPITLIDYNNIAKKILDETKVTAQTKVTTFMNVELSAKTDQGVIDKKSTSSLEIPLSGTYFKIIKKQIESKPEALEKVNKVQRPIDIKLLTMVGTGIAISLVALLILLFGTNNLEVDTFTKKLKKIFKKYGTRLVALNSEIVAGYDLQSNVHSMEDLVRISDEIGKPIIYKHSDHYMDNLTFWVMDEDIGYVYELEQTESSGHSLRERVLTSGATKGSASDGVTLDKN